MESLTNATFNEIKIGDSASVTRRLSRTEVEALALVGGENSALIRERVCVDAAWLGVRLDKNANDNPANSGCITTDRSHVSGWVVHTDEELMIARHTLTVIRMTAANEKGGHLVAAKPGGLQHAAPA